MIQPEFLKPVIQVLQYLETPGLHPDQHVLEPGLDRHGPVLELRMLVQDLEALRSVLICQRLARTLQRLAPAIPWPRPRQTRAPQLQCRRVNDSGCLANPITLRDVDSVCIPVPNQLNRRKWVIPSEIHPTNTRPVVWEVRLLAGEQFFGDGKDAARAQRRNALGASLTLMSWVSGGDLGLFLLGIMSNIVERHRRVTAIGRRLKQKSPDYLTHAEQRRDRYPYRALRHVRAREPFGVDVGRRLLIEP